MILHQSAVSRRSLLVGLAGLATVPLLAACGGNAAATATTAAVPSTAAATATITSAPAASSASVATVTTTTAGGSTASTAAAAKTSAAVANGAVKLIWLDYNGGKQQQVFEQIIKQFSAAHDGVTVEYNLVDGGQMATKAIAMVAGGTPPDLLTHDTGLFAAYAGKGLLRPLNDLIATANWKPSDILPNVWQIFSVRGKYYTVPFAFSAFAVAYNKDLLSKAGLAEPKADWSWTDFQSYAQHLTQSSGGKPSQYGFDGVASDMLYWKPWVEQNDGVVIDQNLTSSGVDAQPAIDALTFWGNLQLKDRVTPQPGDKGFGFSAGNIAMSWNQPTIIGAIKNGKKVFDVGAVPPPKGKKQAALLTARGIATTKDSKHAQDAFDFATFVVAPQSAKQLADLDIELSANQAVAQSQTWGKPWLDCIAFGAPLPVVPTLPQIRTDTGKEMATYLSGKVDLQTVAGQMKTTIDQLLKNTTMPG
jgi:multiple sugar transport system substrate-binding protein